jgi:hypothetical protein
MRKYLDTGVLFKNNLSTNFLALAVFLVDGCCFYQRNMIRK